MVKLKISLYGTLHYLIETENYRMLSKQEYTWRESPLRSGRVCELKERTIVRIEIIIKYCSYIYSIIFTKNVYCSFFVVGSSV